MDAEPRPAPAFDPFAVCPTCFKAGGDAVQIDNEYLQCRLEALNLHIRELTADNVAKDQRIETLEADNVEKTRQLVAKDKKIQALEGAIENHDNRDDDQQQFNRPKPPKPAPKKAGKKAKRANTKGGHRMSRRSMGPIEEFQIPFKLPC